MTALRITTDPLQVNAFINHPAVFPHCGFGDAAWADVTSRINDDDLVFVTDDVAAMIGFHRQSADTWEKHNLFLPSCRGGKAIDMGRAIFAWFFRWSGCARITAGTPIANRPARWFNRQIGMVSQGIGFSPQFGEVEHFNMEARLCR